MGGGAGSSGEAQCRVGVVGNRIHRDRLALLGGLKYDLVVLQLRGDCAVEAAARDLRVDVADQLTLGQSGALGERERCADAVDSEGHLIRGAGYRTSRVRVR